MEKPFTRIAAVIFGLVAAVNLLRLILHFSVIIAGYQVPLFLNAIGFMISAPLAVMLWSEK